MVKSEFSLLAPPVLLAFNVKLIEMKTIDLITRPRARNLLLKKSFPPNLFLPLAPVFTYNLCDSSNNHCQRRLLASTFVPTYFYSCSTTSSHLISKWLLPLTARMLVPSLLQPPSNSPSMKPLGPHLQPRSTPLSMKLPTPHYSLVATRANPTHHLLKTCQITTILIRHRPSILLQYLLTMIVGSTDY